MRRTGALFCLASAAGFGAMGVFGKLAYDAGATMPVTAPVALAAKPWPYESFGVPGAVVERRELGADLGATAVRFANGTRLTVKPTTFKSGEIVVQVRFGGAGKPATAPFAAFVI